MISYVTMIHLFWRNKSQSMLYVRFCGSITVGAIKRIGNRGTDSFAQTADDRVAVVPDGNTVVTPHFVLGYNMIIHPGNWIGID